MDYIIQHPLNTILWGVVLIILLSVAYLMHALSPLKKYTEVDYDAKEAIFGSKVVAFVAGFYVLFACLPAIAYESADPLVHFAVLFGAAIAVVVLFAMSKHCRRVMSKYKKKVPKIGTKLNRRS
ncbi:MAG: hypothetical protein JWN28_752 [Candidatus Saccharibacteria bacterium]|nr:hypothetical protein [Candidatus Saccharibacteria bacterium]